MKHYFSILLCCIFVLFGTLPTANAQEDKKPETTENADAKKTDSKKKKGKTFTDVITDEAETDEGLFNVHKVGSKFYFEIPKDILEKEILVVSRISGHVKGLNFGGAGMRPRNGQVIRFQHKDDKILLREVSYDAVANEEDPIAKSVKANNFEPIIQSFNLETFNEDSTGVVVDVTSFFTSDIPMIGALSDSERTRFGIRSLDKARSLINYIKAFPQNVEVRHILTYNGTKLPDNQQTSTLSIEMNQSFVLLPEEPMMPRNYDARVGYYEVRQTDYSADEQKAFQRSFIGRWRLEPKDEAAYLRGELVEPKKPIVYYIDPATPEKWRPYIKQGVDDWQSAFEKAGFKNAIMAKDPPSPEEDPEWSPEDVRYSVIRYVSTDIQNAMGPSVKDPRTGEILESDIIWYHNVMNLLRNWFFSQTAAVNPEARKVKFDDELMGELIRFVSAHEVGHTLGLPHNMGASVAYPVDSLRKAGFVQRMGVSPSIMDYARFNYVAQPEDKGVGLFPKIGPYDEWSIIYGYKYLPNINHPDEEEATLNQWIKERAGNPYYRYGQAQRGGVDPSAQTEDIGSNAVEASDLGVKNLQLIMSNLLEWTQEDGKDYSTLGELYRYLAGQFNRYVGHVTSNIGGVYEYDKTSDEEGAVYTHVSKDRQRAAVNWVNRQVFTTPNWMMQKDILSRIQSTGYVNTIRSIQDRALGLMFNGDRMLRMTENEAINGTEAYTLGNMFDDTRRGVFSEVYNGGLADAFRRNLHRSYIDKMADLMKLTESQYDQSDIKTLARATLNRLEGDLKEGIKKQKDEMTRNHFEDLLARIEMIKEGKMPVAAARAAASGRALDDDEWHNCWDNDLGLDILNEQH